MKVVIVVSTLQKSGPTNQLYNLIEYMDGNFFQVCLVTLSPEPANSMWRSFEKLGVRLKTLGLSRIAGLFLAKRSLSRVLGHESPDVIHTQGLRADSLLATLNIDIPWVTTARNFPPDDYPAKFGRLKGSLMVKKHLSVMRSCRHVVACSKSIQNQLATAGIRSVAIQNGVRLQESASGARAFFDNLLRPVFISVGSLIPRKNMQLLIRAFNDLPEEVRGSLLILGEGPLMGELKSEAVRDVRLPGSVNNVADYLSEADYFVSTSLSEGLPNTVLEALASGLPVILSDIEPHLEIARESQSACKIFKLADGKLGLADAMKSAGVAFDGDSREDARRLANEVFSAERMASEYQTFYKSILEVE